MSTQYGNRGETIGGAGAAVAEAGTTGGTSTASSAAGVDGQTAATGMNWGSARSDYGDRAYGGSLDEQGLGGKAYDDFSRGRDAESGGPSMIRAGGSGSRRASYSLGDTGNTGLTLLAGIAIGAGLMYIFDPEQGGRRRALLRDKLVGLSNDAADALGKTSRDLRNRAQGIIAETSKAIGLGGAGEEAGASAGGNAQGGSNATNQRASIAGAGGQ